MRWSRGKCKGHKPIPTTGWKSVPIHIIAECGTGFQPVVCIDALTVYPFLGRDRSFMPRNMAQSKKSCAARISTEPSITPCGGIAIPTAAKRIAAENDAIDIYFFIGIVFFSGCDYAIVIAENPSPQLMLDFYMVAPWGRYY